MEQCGEYSLDLTGSDFPSVEISGRKNDENIVPDKLEISSYRMLWLYSSL